MGGNYGGEDPTADDCIRAGMYWFGQRDYEAASAWWARALELEPYNTRAKQCLTLLPGAEPDKVPWDASGPFSAPLSEPDAGVDLGSIDIEPEAAIKAVEEAKKRADPTTAPRKSLWGDPDSSSGVELWGEAASNPGVDTFNSITPSPTRPIAPTRRQSAGRAKWPPDPRDSGVFPIPNLPKDVIDFAMGADEPTEFDDPSGGVELVAPPIGGEGDNAWDDGPSRTSVITLEAEEKFDAVAGPTPLPKLQLTGSQIADDGALIDYMVSTGDLDLGSQDVPVGQERLPSFRIEPAQTGPKRTPDPEILVVPGTPREARADASAKYDLDDFDGTLRLLEAIPEAEQTSEDRQIMKACRDNLLRMYESKLGGFDRVPRQVIASEEVIWLSLNHRAGFILSQIDGTLTYEDLLALSGMPRLDTVRVLAELLKERVITSS